jgi:hypothetical protein
MGDTGCHWGIGHQAMDNALIRPDMPTITKISKVFYA